MKVDLKKTLDSYQAKSGAFRILEVPPRQYVMLDGHGDPNVSTDFADALEGLYPLAYGLKFTSKNELDQDYVVPPLEGLWWSESELASPGKARLETLDEGRCVQTLHIGSFDDEGPTLDAMHREFIPAQGLAMTGKHHEIYLSDFRRVEPAKLRTILRQPVRPA